jgi:hypothetical protein
MLGTMGKSKLEREIRGRPVSWKVAAKYRAGSRPQRGLRRRPACPRLHLPAPLTAKCPSTLAHCPRDGLRKRGKARRKRALRGRQRRGPAGVHAASACRCHTRVPPRLTRPSHPTPPPPPKPCHTHLRGTRQQAAHRPSGAGLARPSPGATRPSRPGGARPPDASGAGWPRSPRDSWLRRAGPQHRGPRLGLPTRRPQGPFPARQPIAWPPRH